ncbi:MAG: hypothetical protein ACI9UA_002120, partial [Pseudoalteromonas tetraodonis]
PEEGLLRHPPARSRFDPVILSNAGDRVAPDLVSNVP